MMHANRLAAAAMLVAAWVATVARGQDHAVLQPGDLVALCGDSITDQKQYTLMVETYLATCRPDLNARAMAFGSNGETSQGFGGRLVDEVLPFRPNVVVLFYGMNDAGLGSYASNREEVYRRSMANLVAACRKAGVRSVLVASPGVVDPDKYARGDPARYNAELDRFAVLAREIARDNHTDFVDLHAVMADAMRQFKAAHPGVALAGNDGIHPGWNGHLAMACALLRGLGCDGDLGTINFDLTTGRAAAEGGHRVLATRANGMDLESSCYCFVVPGKADDLQSARGALPFLPFDRELNRLTLRVAGAKGPMKVTWGKTSKVFAADRLATGINLAAEFAETPFDDPFGKVFGQIRSQESAVYALRRFMNGSKNLRGVLPDQRDALDRITEAAVAKARTLNRPDLTPVRHTMTFTPADAPPRPTTVPTDKR